MGAVRNRFLFSGAVFTIVFAAFLIVPGISLYGQEYHWKEYTVSDGLPQPQANLLFEDSRGFIWILTRSGISRFDGLEFKNYFRRDGLPSNLVAWILEDHDYTIWAMTLEGLSEYTGYGFRHYPYEGRRKTEGFSYACSMGDSITLILKDIPTGRNRIISFRDGVYTDHTAKYSSMIHMNISSFLVDKSTGDIIMHDSVSYIWRYRKGGLTNFHDVKLFNLKKDRGRIILETDRELMEYTEGEIRPLSLSADSSRVEVNISGSQQGLPIKFFDGHEILEINHPLLSSYLIDSESNLWLGSEVNFHRLLSTAFSSLSEDDGLPKNTWAMACDRHGHIWFGSLTGDLLEFDGRKLIRRDDYRKIFPEGVSFYKGSITTSGGSVLFSTKEGVLVWDGAGFSKIEGLPYLSQVCIIYEDPVDRSLLFGTGLGLYHLKDGEMIHYPEFTADAQGIVEGIVRESEGSYWLSAGKGVAFLDGKNVTRVSDTLISSGFTFTLVRDKMGGIWVTSEEGLFFKEKSSDSFINALPEQISTSANSIIMMDSSRILAGRLTDICIIDLERFYRNEAEYFRIYDATDGFNGNFCLDNGIVRGADGRYWILTSGRAVILDDKKLKTNQIPPKVIVTDVEFQTDTLTWESLRIPGLYYGRQGLVSLGNGKNNIRFRFTGIFKTNPEKVRYQHRLTGLEDIWSGYSNSREAIYMNLKPGHYEFQVRAVSPDGVLSEGVYSLKFNIIPAFWQMLGFKIGFAVLAGFLLVLSTFLVVRQRNRKKQKEAQLKGELMRLQMNSILRQFDPHFTFNVISSVGSVIMKGSAESAYDYIVALSGLLRSAIADGSIMIRPLADEIDFVKRYCELQKLRFRDRISCTVDIDRDVDLQRMLPKMTIQTFVENSIKHGFENRKEGGRVDIRVSRLKGSVLIKISDNGVGRDAAAASGRSGFGQGITTIDRIFGFMNRFNREKAGFEIHDLKDLSGNPSGTEVRIKIPDGYSFDVPESSEL